MARDLSPLPTRDPWVRAGFGVLVLGVLLMAWSAVSAARLTPTDDAAAPQFVVQTALGTRARVPELRVADVVEQNVFAPDRTAPVARYRLDGTDEPDAYREPPPPPMLPVVLGTAVGVDSRHSFAMCQFDGAPTAIVRVGDRLGPFTVRSISRGTVEFTTPSGERVAITANPS